MDVNINSNHANPEGKPRADAIAYELAVAGLMDMGLKFLPRRNLWLKYRCTWRMQWDGQEVQSRTDYILGTDRRLFQDMAIQNTQHHLDHYMVLGCLRGDPAKELTGYLQKVCRFPLQPLRFNFLLALDKLFSELKNQISKLLLCK